jgi:hypothetical protein
VVAIETRNIAIDLRDSMRAKSISERERPFAGGRYRRVDGGESAARRRTSVTHPGPTKGASLSTITTSLVGPLDIPPLSEGKAKQGVTETETAADIKRGLESLHDILEQMQQEHARSTSPSSDAVQRATEVLQRLVERERAASDKTTKDRERTEQSTGAEELALAQDGIDQVLRAATRAWWAFAARRQKS